MKQQTEQKEQELNEARQKLDETIQNLKKSETVVQHYEERIDQYKPLEKELQRLRDENNRLQGVRQFSEAFFYKTFGNDVKDKSFDEIIEMFDDEMEEKGEVVIPFPMERIRAGSKRKKIKFRKVRNGSNQ